MSRSLFGTGTKGEGAGGRRCCCAPYSSTEMPFICAAAKSEMTTATDSIAVSLAIA